MRYIKYKVEADQFRTSRQVSFSARVPAIECKVGGSVNSDGTYEGVICFSLQAGSYGQSEDRGMGSLQLRRWGCGVMLRWRAQVCLAFPESLLTCAGGYERQTWK